MLKSKKTWLALRNLSLALIAVPLLSACGGSIFGKKSNINTTTKFSSAEYGVAASKRVTTSSNVKKGGGRSQIGKPYKVRGKWFTPKHEPNYDRTGVASWYGPNFHGRQTANGEIFDQNALSAAHPTLPLPSYVRVTNLENNRSIIVRVNDRGPFASGRVIDLSKRTADILGVIQKGTARVRVRYVGKAPLEGDDTKILMASLNKSSPLERGGSHISNSSIQIAALTAPLPNVRNTNIKNTGFTQAASGYFIANNNQSTASQTLLTPIFYAENGYSEKTGSDIINGAFAASEAMASRASNLQNWQQYTDQEARKINLELGVFVNRDNANKIIEAFSLIGAVDEQVVTISGKAAIKLSLSYLKYGVLRKDAIDLARGLGLNAIILYN